jgi:DnaJ domain
MPYFVLGVALVIGLVLLVYGAANASPRTLKRILGWSLVVIAAGVAAALIITRQWTFLLFGLVPLFIRWRALWRMARSWHGPSPGRTSDVETKYLRMRLDHDSGELGGTVLAGPYRGRRLDELGLDELLALLRECRVEDEPSVAILEAYLDRAHGADWRNGQSGASSAGAGGGRDQNRSSGGMSSEEAYEILGLTPGAKEAEIRDAHRRLMLKIHPDQGGSTYLAAKINQAKDVLLG